MLLHAYDLVTDLHKRADFLLGSESRRIMEYDEQYRKGYQDGVRAFLREIAPDYVYSFGEMVSLPPKRITGGYTSRQLWLWIRHVLSEWTRNGTGSPPDLPVSWSVLRSNVLERDSHVCQYCGKEEATHVDHIIPIYKSRGDYEKVYAEDNLVACCKECNQKKGTKDLSEFLANHPAIGNHFINQSTEDLFFKAFHMTKKEGALKYLQGLPSEVKQELSRRLRERQHVS